jgi:hypothetical protein
MKTLLADDQGLDDEAAGGASFVKGRARRRPSMLEGLVELIGDEAVSKLVETFGGARIYVPQTVEPGDTLSGVIGAEAAAKLAQIFGGDRMEVPHPASRRTRIIELHRKGVTVDAIALRVGCTRRRVFQVLAEERITQRAALAAAAQRRRPSTDSEASSRLASVVEPVARDY